MTLRIERITEDGSDVLLFSGRIRSNQLADLQSLLLNSQPSVIALDLRNVRLIDRETVRFLASLKSEGIELRNVRNISATGLPKNRWPEGLIKTDWMKVNKHVDC